jgi:ribosomal protein S6
MKLIEDKRIRNYELTYLLPEALTSSEVATAKLAVETLLKKHSIKILSTDDWEKRQLAYPIKFKSKKQYGAYYTHVVLEADATSIPKFENDLFLNQNVIRHLVVVTKGAKKAE